MKSLKFIVILLILTSCKSDPDKKVSSKPNDTTSTTENSNLKNKKFSQQNPDISKDTLSKTNLFLLYKSNISESKFNKITEILIENGKVEKRRSNGRDVLNYLFPYCENSKGITVGENYNRFKLQPIFTNNLLNSIKISGIENGAYTKYKNKWVYCIYKSLIEKYDIDFIYEGDEIIEYSKVAVNNDQYHPIDKIKINQTSNQNYTNPTYIKLPEYLKDRSSHLMPNVIKTIFEYDSKKPRQIAPIVINKNDKIIIIYHNWVLKQSISYSLWEKKGYHDLDASILMNHMQTFVQNSKLEYFKSSYHMNIILEYLTKEEYLKRREEYLKKQNENKKNNTDENPILRNIANEL